MTIAQVQQKADFRLLLPTELPPGCPEMRHTFVDLADQAILNFTCVSIGEQANHDGFPAVGEGATQAVSVNGQPATFVDGTWTTDRQTGNIVWSTGMVRQLFFVQDDLVLTLMTLDPRVDRAGLITIAEHLRASP